MRFEGWKSFTSVHEVRVPLRSKCLVVYLGPRSHHDHDNGYDHRGGTVGTCPNSNSEPKGKRPP